MDFLNSIYERARTVKKTIVLPEGSEDRIIKAAVKVVEQDIANIIILSSEGDKERIIKEFNLPKVQIINPEEFYRYKEYIEELVQMRKDKGLTYDAARELLKNPLYFGAMMVKLKDADGMVAGAITPSADVLRAALKIVKCDPKSSIVSSCFIMDMSGSAYSGKEIVCFADCVVNICPTAEQLARIAISTAETMRSLIGVEPKVAMLSFSTRGSAKHAYVDKVAEAARIAKKIAPGLLIDGEMQLDAAIVESVGRLKCPDSLIAGKANVLIFPDIQSGNIGYKLAERIGGARAIGPVIQGLSSPVNDLSRGCSPDDIVNTIAITAVQAQKLKIEVN